MSKNSEAFEKALARAEAIAAGAAPNPLDALTPEQRAQVEAQVAEAVGAEAEEIEPGPHYTRGVMLFETSDGQFGMREIEGTETTLADVISLARRAEADALVQAVTESVMRALKTMTAQQQAKQQGPGIFKPKFRK